MTRKALRSRIEKQLEKQQEEQKRDLLKRRMEIAKEGARLYQNNRIIEAVKRYQQYILILEMWKKCGRDGLSPEFFDRKKDFYEIVMISGVYWDIAKLYDSTKKGDREKELSSSLQKFVQFSKGFPHQPLSSEALRRYLSSGKCNNREEFKKCYKSISLEKCFVATALAEELEWTTIERLREIRDQNLSKHLMGRQFIRLYYKVGPTLARFTLRLPRELRVGLAAVITLISDLFSRDETSSL